MTSATEFFDAIHTQLLDQEARAWTPEELVRYLNEGLQALVPQRPERFQVNRTHTLVQGARQVLTDPLALRFTRLTRLLNADGTSARVLTLFDPQAMGAIESGWAMSTPAAPRQYAPDSLDPRAFWVYPPASGGQAEVQYLKAPPVINLDTRVLPFDQAFEQPLTDYVLYRAYAKDSEYAGQDARAAFHLSAYREGIHGATS